MNHSSYLLLVSDIFFFEILNILTQFLTRSLAIVDYVTYLRYGRLPHHQTNP